MSSPYPRLLHPPVSSRVIRQRNKIFALRFFFGFICEYFILSIYIHVCSFLFYFICYLLFFICIVFLAALFFFTCRVEDRISLFISSDLSLVVRVHVKMRLSFLSFCSTLSVTSSSPLFISFWIMALCLIYINIYKYIYNHHKWILECSKDIITFWFFLTAAICPWKHARGQLCYD